MRTLTIITAGGPPRPTPGTDTPHGPLVRFLYDPDAFFASTWDSVGDFFTTWWPVALPSTITTLGVLAGKPQISSGYSSSPSFVSGRLNGDFWTPRFTTDIAPSRP